MRKSEYSFEFRNFGPFKFLLIRDEDGVLNVTNDIENIIMDIFKRRAEDPKDYKVIYRDTEGIWDSYDLETDTFMILRAYDEDEAMQKYIDKSK